MAQTVSRRTDETLCRRKATFAATRAHSWADMDSTLSVATEMERFLRRINVRLRCRKKLKLSVRPSRSNGTSSVNVGEWLVERFANAHPRQHETHRNYLESNRFRLKTSQTGSSRPANGQRCVVAFVTILSERPCMKSYRFSYGKG